MLPQSYRDRYQKFQLALEKMQQSQSSSSPVSAVRDAFTSVQEIFQHQILGNFCDELDPTIAARLRSYLTEIDKQLRLLGVDVMFLQASRQPATLQTRFSQINSRLQTLIGYCQAIVQTE